MPELSPVSATPTLGPEYDSREKGRDQYSHALAETASLTDRVFEDTASLQKLTFEDFTYPNNLEVDEILTKEEITDEYREMMEEHVERRIQFFFQQLITCYQTKLHFESVGASDQAQSAKTIYFKVDQELVEFTARHAAHSSTSPRLIAYDQKEWEEYKAGKRDKPKGFVFLKGSDYYRTQQATINMPRWINDADSAIDGKPVESKLRQKTEDLVNLAAQGKINPEEGVSQFIKEALAQIEKEEQRVKNKGDHPEVAHVLRYYKTFFLQFQEEVSQDPTFLEKFLNIRFKSASDDPSKRVILNIRYAAIRNVQINQAKLIQKVEKVRQEILGRRRKPNFFDAAFKTTLVEAAKTPENRHRLEKLLNFSPDQFTAQYEQRNITMFRNTKLGLAPFAEKIAFVANDILHDMRHLQTEEATLRGRVTRELRWMKGWSQKELGDRIARVFTRAACSQSTISRIENNQKLVTPQIAEELSQVFDVDPGLFIPHFFYE